MDGVGNIKALAANAKELLLPNKSKCLYENMYTAYCKWCTTKKIIKTTEDSILAYFNSELCDSLSEKKGSGQKPKKSHTLTKENVDNFLIRADNKEHLLNKVILIFGVAGACRRQELASLTKTCVEDCKKHFLAKLVDTKTKKDKSFIIVPGELENLNLLEIIRKYIQLRPAAISPDRFFINYIREKCIVSSFINTVSY